MIILISSVRRWAIGGAFLEVNHETFNAWRWPRNNGIF
jgi:hypothetical protein